ncbi:hypothetical protein ONZ45_g13412 [Pleurotus djamor]|nr:hypothetical protein ONZ45_g13412 [Pleurotus djamor]
MVFIPFSKIVHAINASDQGLMDTIDLAAFVAFVQLAHHLKAEIALHVPHGVTRPPYRLPSYLCCILAYSLGLSDEHVSYLWETLQDSIWNEDWGTTQLPAKISERLDLFGMSADKPSECVASTMFYPPVSSCNQCNRPLKYSTLSRYQVTSFSLDHGSKLGYVSSFRCSSCSIRFYPNYYVSDGLRHYYSSEIPSAIQIEDHAFISSDLCELFTLNMLFAWVSSQNNSHIYNTGLSRSSDLERSSKLTLTSDQAWRGFVYHALLRDSQTARVPLVVRDTGTNDKRLQEAMEKRNEDYINDGQPERLHACRICENLLPGTGYHNLHDIETVVELSHKSAGGNTKLKARFGRRRTNHEQLVVACCGVIAGRATMFAEETVSDVKDFFKSIYPHTADLPDVIFYDNNCQLQAHILKEKDPFFKGIIFPVDAFHYKSKHKTPDEFCQKHCNPARWPELVVDDGKWRFNSSVAEQANAWLGGYLAIVREMLPHRFEFFLDEMIKRRNEYVVEKLWQEGKIPYRIPLWSPDEDMEYS